MIIFRNITIAMVSLLLLTQCKHPLVGEWRDEHIFIYVAELTLKEDGTFRFHGEGCLLRHDFTEGYWKEDMGKIMLTSYDSYKPVEPVDTGHAVEIFTDSTRVDNLTLMIDTISINTALSRLDTFRMYFDKVQLYIKGDTLLGIDSSKSLWGYKFIRLKKRALTPSSGSLRDSQTPP